MSETGDLLQTTALRRPKLRQGARLLPKMALGTARDDWMVATISSIEVLATLGPHSCHSHAAHRPSSDRDRAASRTFADVNGIGIAGGEDQCRLTSDVLGLHENCLG